MEEEPSRARATGISSSDSAESEWYSAGGPAALTGPEGVRGGREALRGNAGKGTWRLRVPGAKLPPSGCVVLILLGCRLVLPAGTL